MDSFKCNNENSLCNSTEQDYYLLGRCQFNFYPKRVALVFTSNFAYRWFLYNFNFAGSRLYIANGLAMLGVFFCARNLLGLFMLISFFRASGNELSNFKATKEAMSPIMLWVYRIACVALTCLNAMWFYKMLLGAIRVVAKSKNASTVEQEITES